MKNFGGFYVFVLFFSFSSLHSAGTAIPSETTSFASFFTEAARTGAAIAMVGLLEKSGYRNTACGLGGVVLLSELQKQNPEFFNSVTGIVKAPFILTRKRLERLFCNGESLSWNEIVTSRNRVMRLLSPLTKQTTVVDLSRDKRLRLMDQEDDKGQVRDEQWTEYVQHIDSQLTFMSNMLQNALNFYENEQKKSAKVTCTCCVCLTEKYVVKPTLNFAKAGGSACVRISTKRNEEIAFYLKELKVYLKEIIDYSKSVLQLADLDKERIKRLMNSTCDAFEHIAVLVDAGTASAPASKPVVGQLAMQRDSGAGAGAGAGYGGYGYGGYSV